MFLLLKQFTLQTYRSCFVIRCSSRFFVSKIGTIHDNSNNGQSIGFRRLETRYHSKRRDFVQLAIQATDGPQGAERLSFRSNTTFTYMPWSRSLVFLTPSLTYMKIFSWDWILTLYIRNVALIFLVTGTVHFWLYII